MSAASPAQAANSLCPKAYISSLSVGGSTEIASGTDLCNLTEKKIPEKFKKLIQNIGAIHAQAAEILGTTPESLFAHGVCIYISAEESGLGGDYNGAMKLLEIDTVPNPAEWLNEGIYAHELGHWLADSRNEVVPAAIRASTNSFLLSETFADTFALALVNTVESPDSTLPSCLQSRAIENNQSYGLKRGFFLVDQNDQRIQSCCVEAHAKYSANGEAVCAALTETDSDEPRKAVPAFDAGAFDATLVSADQGQYDSHQIGVPINSFLRDLGEKTGQNIFRLFIQSSRKAEGEIFQCALPKSKADILPVNGYTLKSQLTALANALAATEQKTFQDLWREHGLDTAVEMDAKDYPGRVQQLAFEAFKAKLADTGQRKNRCFGAYAKAQSVEDLSSACRPQCNPAPAL